jgi:hypothetical protein
MKEITIYVPVKFKPNEKVNLSNYKNQKILLQMEVTKDGQIQNYFKK